jgi:hypothetical protein
MNIILNINQYNDDSIFFCDPINNNIIINSTFIRIFYVNNMLSLNGIYLFINLIDFNYNIYFNKYKCNFSINSNKEIINNLKIIEENILTKINIQNKQPQYKLYNQLMSNNIKLFNIDKFNTNNCSFNLKISGIWETTQNYGLTYKFIKIND